MYPAQLHRPPCPHTHSKVGNNYIGCRCRTASTQTKSLFSAFRASSPEPKWLGDLVNDLVGGMGTLVGATGYPVRAPASCLGPHALALEPWPSCLGPPGASGSDICMKTCMKIATDMGTGKCTDTCTKIDQVPTNREIMTTNIILYGYCPIFHHDGHLRMACVWNGYGHVRRHVN